MSTKFKFENPEKAMKALRKIENAARKQSRSEWRLHKSKHINGCIIECPFYEAKYELKDDMIFMDFCNDAVLGYGHGNFLEEFDPEFYGGVEIE